MSSSRTAIWVVTCSGVAALCIWATFSANTARYKAPAAAPAVDTQPPVDVVIASATRVEIAPVHWSPGNVVSREDARVAAEVGGRVTKVLEIGTWVRKGEAVTWLDATVPMLKVREAKATLRRIGAQLTYSRTQEQRYEELQRQQAISAAYRDQIKAEREIREQEREVAQAVFDEAENRVRHAVIRAPFDGVVVERLIQRGEYLDAGAAVVRLVNTRNLEVRARAPLALASQLRTDARVSLRSDDLLIEQTLLSVIPVGDNVSRQLELRVSLKGVDLPIGSAVQVGLRVGDSGKSLAVPRDALVLRREGNYVIRVTADGVAEQVHVIVGAAQDDLIEIRGPLHSGDRVIVRGAERVQPGQRVRVAKLAHISATEPRVAAAKS